ncbi:MAG TPA: hypothetical protein PL029_11580, partial [Bacteroidia bacterium]|nr:hypothetical protein [Bacteroidia bacterium]
MNKLLSILAIVSLTLVGCGNQSNNEKQEKHIETLTPPTVGTAMGASSDTTAGKNSYSNAADNTFSKTTETEKEPVRSISELLRQLEKTTQTFSISHDKDVTIVCAEGTSIKIKGNSFVSAGSGNEITEDLKIEVKEYYKLSDILIANLSTTSGKDILETGGMIYMAATSGNKNCVLKKESSIEIGFPYLKKKEQMELFNGDLVSDKVNWTRANNTGRFQIGPRYNVGNLTTSGETSNDTAFKREFEKSTNESNIQGKGNETVGKYLLSSSKLGWINCDRFYRDPAPKINYIVDGGDATEINMNLVFHSVKATLSGFGKGTECTFNSVPTGKKVTIVAVKKVHDKMFFA